PWRATCRPPSFTLFPYTTLFRSLQGNLAATLSARAAGLSKAERTLAEALCVRRGPLPLALCRELSDDKRARSLFRNLDELVAKGDRKSTRLNSSHQIISYAVFCL